MFESAVVSKTNRIVQFVSPLFLMPYMHECISKGTLKVCVDVWMNSTWLKQKSMQRNWRRGLWDINQWISRWAEDKAPNLMPLGSGHRFPFIIGNLLLLFRWIWRLVGQLKMLILQKILWLKPLLKKPSPAYVWNFETLQMLPKLLAVLTFLNNVVFVTSSPQKC